MIKFAQLISYITAVRTDRCGFTNPEIEQIHAYVQAMIDEALQRQSKSFANGDDVKALFSHMINGKPIDAIKVYRALTGATLIDAKNVIEKAMH